jgi:hypothetical protein
MERKRAFIQIPILIAVIVSIVVVSGIGYGAIEYHKTSKIIKESEQLTKEEKYNEAIKKLEVAQNKFLGKTILKQKISTKLEENKKLLADKIKYDEGIKEFNNNNFQKSIDLLSELPESSFYYQKAQTKIEEAKRKIIEAKLSKEQIIREEAEKKATQEKITREEAEAKARQEQIAREEAERKARQVEAEKELKEQQLRSKEAEEEMMNADNDGDGLTYREELQKGTSDFNKDSDFDGIPDNLDLHPAGGGRYLAQTFTWIHGGYNWTWTFNIHEDWYEYYKNKPRLPYGSLEYITYNDPFIKDIAKQISETAEKYNLDKVDLAVTFVQSLSYVKDIYTGYDEYPKYPVETVVEKNGDCEDTTHLLASILRAMNIGCALLNLPRHAAVGILLDCGMPGRYYYKVGNKCYYYTETAGKGWFPGAIPDEFKSTPADLKEIPSGEEIDEVWPQYNTSENNNSEILACFLSGTKVLMADGTYKNIENIKPGEKVVSFNLVNKKTTFSKVEKLFRKIDSSYLIINNRLKLVPHQFIYVNGKWEEAKNVKIGDNLLNSEGKQEKVVSVSNIVNENVLTYDLELESIGNFFAENYLVKSVK